MQFESYYSRHIVLALVEAIPDAQKNAIRWYIYFGDGDRLSEGNALVYLQMKKKQISHEYRVRDGDHNWTYWRKSLPKVLEFVSASFHQF